MATMAPYMHDDRMRAHTYSCILVSHVESVWVIGYSMVMDDGYWFLYDNCMTWHDHRLLLNPLEHDYCMVRTWVAIISLPKLHLSFVNSSDEYKLSSFLYFVTQGHWVLSGEENACNSWEFSFSDLICVNNFCIHCGWDWEINWISCCENTLGATVSWFAYLSEWHSPSKLATMGFSFLAPYNMYAVLHECSMTT